MDKPEPDWKELAHTLGRDLIFALSHLETRGSGVIYDLSGKEEPIHWRHKFANHLEEIPGISVDREAAMAMELPAKERRKFFNARARAKGKEGA